MKRIKRWDKRLAQALERVGRGKRLAVNLLLCALIGGLIWMRQGWPLSTAEQEFRRLERTHLLPPSEIVFQTAAPGQAFSLPDGPKLRLSVRYFVGLREDGVTLCAMERSSSRWYRSIVSLPRGDGPVLVPLLRECKYLEPVGWWPVGDREEVVSTQEALVFLLLDAPAQTARAELIVRDESQGEELSGGGWPLEDGTWLLALESDMLGRTSFPYQNVTCTFKLFGQDGSLLLERTAGLAAQP